MKYICEKCGKEYQHKGDYEKHILKRKSTCIKTGITLVDRLQAIETALVSTGVQLKLPAGEHKTTTMGFPASVTEAKEQGIENYTEYLRQWMIDNKMSEQLEIITARKNKEGIAFLIDKYSAEAVMNIPPKATIAAKQAILKRLFQGDFDRQAGTPPADIPAAKPKRAPRKPKVVEPAVALAEIAQIVDAAEQQPVDIPAAKPKRAPRKPKAGGKDIEPAAAPAQIAEAAATPMQERPQAVYVNPAHIIDHVPIMTADGTKLRNMFERFEQSMRDNSGITGEKAKDDIIALFVLRALQSRIESGRIDVLDMNKHLYPRQFITEENIQYVLMKNLARLPKESLMVELGRIWRMVLAKHPVTSALYRNDKFLNLKDDSLLASIVSELSAFDMENCDRDVLSDVYQHFIHKQFNGDKGSKLGQHFTPIHIVRFILRDVLPFMNSNQCMIDPFMGTAGFIVEAYRALSTVRNDSPAEYLFGTEIDNDVYICSVANVMMATGQICAGLESRSAFIQPTNFRRYDLILTNPPFGMSFSNADAYNKTLWFNHAKIKNGNLICLQYLMHILAEGGVCSFVWPFGSECYSSNEKMVSVRRRLFDEFEVIRVVMLPNGTFEHAGVATVIITFRKPYAGQKPEKRLRVYQYADGAKTYTELTQLCDASAEQLAQKKYSLNPKDYTGNNALEKRIGFEWKKIGDIMDFIPSTKFKTSEGLDYGEYRFYASSQEKMLFTNTPTIRNRKCVILGNGGTFNIHIDSNFTPSKHVTAIYPKNNEVLPEYIYYYIKFASEKISELFNGVGVKWMNRESISNVDIPIPSLEHQEEIANVIEKLESGIRATEEAISSAEFELECLGKRVFKFVEGEYEIHSLDNIVTFTNGQSFTKSEIIPGIYPVIGGGKSTMGYHNAYNTPAKAILMSKDGAYAGFISRYDTEIFANNSCMRIITREHYNNDYVYYYLKFVAQKMIYEKQEGAAQPHVYAKHIAILQIPIPSTEKQREIVIHFDAIVADIKTLEAIRDRKIAFLKEHAKFLFG